MVTEASLFLKSCSMALRLPWNVMAVAPAAGWGHLPRVCPPPTSPQWGRGRATPDGLMPIVAFQLGKTCALAPTPLSTPFCTHTSNGSWPTGCQAEQKEGISFCAPSCQARSPDPLYLILAAWAERVPASRALAGSVFNQPLQLPEQELNVQCICQSLLTSFFFL